MTRKKGTAYLRFCALGVCDVFFVALRGAVLAAFRRVAAAARRVVRTAAGRELRVPVVAVARRGVAAAERDAGAGRAFSSSDRDDRCTSVNRIWSPSAWKAQISLAVICRSPHSWRATSIIEPGTYRWNGARERENATHCDIASTLFTDSAVSTSTMPRIFRPLSVDCRTRSGNQGDCPMGTGAFCSFPRLRETSNFLLYFACRRRMTRSCSSCSRTGRKRIGLNETSGGGSSRVNIA